jgi:hypothetical protein
MATLNPVFNFGDEIKNINPTLYNQLNDFYIATARVLNTKPSTHTTNTDPLASSQVNSGFLTGDFWVNQSTDTAWIMTSRTTKENVI